MKQKTNIKNAQIFAILAALFFGISTPICKVLLGNIPPVILSGLLYSGAGIGMLFLVGFESIKDKTRVIEAKIDKEDRVWVLLMLALDVAAPILLMFGLAQTTASNASLLFNFEIVATSFIAMVFFKENLGRKTVNALLIILFASVLISIDFSSTEFLNFSLGSILVVLACVCWGFENNCTRNLSGKDPKEIVVIKGLCCGTISLIIGFFTESYAGLSLWYVVIALAIGFVAYGLSVYYYIKAQRWLGATRTSAYYALAPFFGVACSFVFLQEPLNIFIVMGMVFMMLGVFLLMREKHKHQHDHRFQEHDHSHDHIGVHHRHSHDNLAADTVHTHDHIHENMAHAHGHTPDLHHRHVHEKH